MCACDMPRGPSLCETRWAGHNSHIMFQFDVRERGIITGRRTNRSVAAAAVGPVLCVGLCVCVYASSSLGSSRTEGSRDGARCRADDVQQQQQQQQQLSELRAAAAAAERSSAVIMSEDRRAAGEKSLTQVGIRDSQRRD